MPPAAHAMEMLVMAMGRDRPVPPADRAALVTELIPFALLDEPLEYIFAAHARQRAVCASLRKFARQGFAERGEADMVAAFLTQDRVLHQIDEDEELFPAVRRRAAPSDNLGVVLARLSDDHRRSQATIDMIVSVLCKNPARETQRLSVAECELLESFATMENRHLAIENSVVLSIARIRLSPGDLKSMSRAMKARRGVGVK